MIDEKKERSIIEERMEELKGEFNKTKRELGRLKQELEGNKSERIDIKSKYEEMYK